MVAGDKGGAHLDLCNSDALTDVYNQDLCHNVLAVWADPFGGWPLVVSCT